MLTATAAPTFEQLAEIASDVTGRTIGFEAVTPDAWLAAQESEHMARFTLGRYQAAAGGFFAGTDPLLTELLGREPGTARDVLAQATG